MASRRNKIRRRKRSWEYSAKVSKWLADNPETRVSHMDWKTQPFWTQPSPFAEEMIKERQAQWEALSAIEQQAWLDECRVARKRNGLNEADYVNLPLPKGTKPGVIMKNIL